MTKCAVKPYKGDDRYIFVCYCHKDSARVFPILEHLAEEGYRIWYDEGIDLGSSWPEIIEEQLQNCSACISFITENSVHSHNCRREQSLALLHHKTLVPVVLEPVAMSPAMELQFASLQSVLKYEMQISEFYEKFESIRELDSCRELPEYIRFRRAYTKKAKEKRAERNTGEKSKKPMIAVLALIAVLLTCIFGLKLSKSDKLSALNASTSPRIVSAITEVGNELESSNVNSERSFEAMKATDGLVDTCWCAYTDEMGAGGAGASVRFQLEEKSLVSGISLVNGTLYQPADALYKSNGQVKLFTLTFSDGKSMSFTAAYNDTASSEPQFFDFESTVVTEYIILTVDSAYVGEKYTENVCLTEFNVYYNDVAATEQVEIIQPDSPVDAVEARIALGTNSENTSLNMYAAPANSATVVAQIPDAAIVTIQGYSNNDSDWIYIRYNESEGWIHGEYLAEIYFDGFDILQN